jgi:hypothetical protein
MDFRHKYLKYKKKYFNALHGGSLNEVRLLDGTVKTINDVMFDLMSGWILFCLRELVGYAEIRQTIILNFLEKLQIESVYKEIITIDPHRKDDTEVINLCDKIITYPDETQKIFIFTGTNLPDPITFETHYNIFIVDKSQNLLLIIDPASKLALNKKTGEYISKSGIYEPYLAKEVIIPFFKDHGYRHSFIASTVPAQTQSDDVFCQTWTLVILKKYLENISNKLKNPVQPFELIVIPHSIEDKYSLLLEFYKYMLTVFPEVQGILNNIYAGYINSNTQINKKNKEILIKINPSLTILEYFKSDDFIE